MVHKLKVINYVTNVHLTKRLTAVQFFVYSQGYELVEVLSLKEELCLCF